MPDITMCKGNGCPYREGCYRFTATPSEFRQAWFFKEPITEKEGYKHCDMFMRDTSVELYNKAEEIE